MWLEEYKKLYRKFDFKDFAQAQRFMNRVGEVAERLEHHPTWSNTFNIVEIWLSTHDAGDIVTDKDRALADAIDGVYAEMTAEKSEPEVAKKTTGEMGDLTEAKLYTDGGSRGNPGASASACIILDMDGNVVEKSGKYIGVTTNNQAEYQALRWGMERLLELGVQRAEVYMDSLLVVNQMKGIFKVKNRDLWPIYENAKEVSKQFKSISFNHVPRELNKEADGEVNRILDEKESGYTS